MRDYGVPSIARAAATAPASSSTTASSATTTRILIGEEATVDGHRLRARSTPRVRRLNRIHGHYDIPNDEFAYVLATTIVGPVRWIEPLRLAPARPARAASRSPG